MTDPVLAAAEEPQMDPEIKAAREELIDLKLETLVDSHPELYCDACNTYAGVLQGLRKKALANPADPLHSHHKVHNIGLHLAKHQTSICNVTHFVQLRNESMTQNMSE